jgi:hypothetical protein
MNPELTNEKGQFSDWKVLEEVKLKANGNPGSRIQGRKGDEKPKSLSRKNKNLHDQYLLKSQKQS